jgi:hypothetical protein
MCRKVAKCWAESFYEVNWYIFTSQTDPSKANISIALILNSISSVRALLKLVALGIEFSTSWTDNGRSLEREKVNFHDLHILPKLKILVYR